MKKPKPQYDYSIRIVAPLGGTKTVYLFVRSLASVRLKLAEQRALVFQDDPKASVFLLREAQGVVECSTTGQADSWTPHLPTTLEERCGAS